MKSRTLPSFWQMYKELPVAVQGSADRSYRLWSTNPFANSLRFKRVSEREPVYSVRVGLEHRALGLLEGDTIYWYFIGDHDAYERALKGL